MSTLFSRVAGGAVWMTALMVADRLLSFVSMLILARLLAPEDFGLVAMCTSIIALLSVFSAFGFDMVLIQRQQRASSSHYHTVWTLRFIVTAVISAAIFVAAYPASSYFREPMVVAPLQVLAIGFFLRSFESIRVVDFRKDLEFQKEALFQFAPKLFGFLATVSIAWHVQSHWALVIGIVSINVSAVVLSHFMKPYLPHLSLRETRDVFRFSAWMLITNLLQVVRLRASHFVIGRLGAGALGYYEMADTVTTVGSQMVAAANRAIFPGYSRISSSSADLAQMFHRVVSAAALLAMPIGFGIAAVASIAVPVLFGPAWNAAIAPMQVLAFHGVLLAVGSNANYILLAVDRPRLVTYVQSLQIAVLLPLLIVLSDRYGLVGAAWAYVVATGIRFPFLLGLLRRYVGVSPLVALAGLWRPLIASSIMYFCVRAYLDSMTATDLVNLTAACVLGAIVFVASSIVLALASPESTERRLMEYVAARFTARRTNTPQL